MNSEPSKILVRLPNWLGDMIMSLGFLDALQQTYPRAAISVIAKKGIDSLLDFFPTLEHRFVFSKTAYPGIKGSWRFGRQIRATAKFDLFFSLPDSFSSALTGFATGAKQRIGFDKEMRGLLLTKTYKRKSGLHRVEEYIDLLQQFNPAAARSGVVRLQAPWVEQQHRVILNINSEAVSRRLPLRKSAAFIRAITQRFDEELVLVGGPADAPYVKAVLEELGDATGITDRSGQTSLPELVELMLSAKLVVTTDSGPAHLANALGVPTIVLFGAGNENNTAPYNAANRQVVRLGELPCEPCVRNTCIFYGIPQCLDKLDIGMLTNMMSAQLTS